MDKEINLVSGWTSLLKKRKALGNKARELIELSEDGKCSFAKGYMTQEVYLCKTCNTSAQGSGICVGCYLTCHIDHEVHELGVKPHFRCDCGNPNMKNQCEFLQKPSLNSENHYSHNFQGKFCICSQEDSDDRDCEMYMCIKCYDWFHSDCIELSNNCHNHSLIHLSNIPKIPEENIIEYYFICFQCISEWKFIPTAYKEYIYWENPVKRLRDEGCPMENVEILNEFPYHVFVKKNWVDERCGCERCKRDFWPSELLDAGQVDEKEGLLEKIQKESERIMLEEEEGDVEYDASEEEEVYREINALPHEKQINLANGYRILKEAFDEIAGGLAGGVGDMQAIERFKEKLQEKHEAYKKAKVDFE